MKTISPIISKRDYNTIKNLFQQVDSTANATEVQALKGELKKAKIVEEDKMRLNIVRLYSTVKIKDMNTGRSMEYQLVLPSMADLSEKKISILAPLGVALIGFKEGQTIEWQMPAGKREIKIVKVKQVQLSSLHDPEIEHSNR